MNQEIVIVGAGFSGAVIASCLADRGYNVLLLDRRNHIGGNAYDEVDEFGVLVQRYGAHIFHTGSKRIFDYLSRYTGWNDYQHKVLAQADGELYPLPININTLSKIYQRSFTVAQMKAHIEESRIPMDQVDNAEDFVLDSVGRELYEKFFYHYTKKQWGRHPSELSASVTARVPVRYSDDDRYFQDPYQGLPDQGYNVLFENLLDHKKIQIELEVDFFQIRNHLKSKFTIYTGPVDQYFDDVFGRLPYRSLRFEYQHFPDMEQYQAAGVVNYTGDEPHTRILEFKQMTLQSCTGTTIAYEYPSAEGEPYYPVPCAESKMAFKKYKKLVEKEAKTAFVGRLAQYRYYNMDQATAAALKFVEDFL